VIIFQDKTQNLVESIYFQKNYLFKIDYKNIWHIGETINKLNKIFQNVSFENPFYENMFFGKMTLKGIIVLNAK